jgi:hypothetical protein
MTSRPPWIPDGCDVIASLPVLGISGWRLAVGGWRLGTQIPPPEVRLSALISPILDTLYSIL